VAAGICLREIPVAARILTGVLAAWWVRFLPPSRRFLVGVLGSPTFSFPARQPRRLSTSLLQLGKSKGKGKQSHYSLAFLCLGELFPRAEQSRASLLLFFASAHPPTTHYNSPQPNPTSPIDWPCPVCCCHCLSLARDNWLGLVVINCYPIGLSVTVRPFTSFVHCLSAVTALHTPTLSATHSR